jgi:hypothetical protein
MAHRENLFTKTGFHGFCFVFCLALFTWPLLDIFERLGGCGLFVFLFSAWAVVISALGCIAAKLCSKAGTDIEAKNREAGGV